MHTEQTHSKQYFLKLTIGALGVVYGDIGTSPLYALKECFSATNGISVTPDNVFGILSLIFWSLMLVVSLKYVTFIMRADNNGEGGILALTALTLHSRKKDPRKAWTMIILGMIGASLFYGDGIITPAISVLSAVEGLEIASDALKSYVVPVTIAVLIVLFAFQRLGTASVGAFFGPIMCVWFSVLALLGVISIAQHPSILLAFLPFYAIEFVVNNGMQAFFILGSVVLVMTGAEALYADMGHFGKKPIQKAWFYFVCPALLLNYFGQGALLITNPQSVVNPFYLLAPSWATYPLVALATLATVIASQAVISGVFSLTRQAIQLDICPRMEIAHTSEAEVGQIYVPRINSLLLIAIIILVLGFESSSNLAAAYGIAVTGTMVITTLLAFIALRKMWHWKPWLSMTAIIVFLGIDLLFFTANIVKIPQGGWFPIIVSIAIFGLMFTWKQGRALLAERLKAETLPIKDFLSMIDPQNPYDSGVLRVQGTAIFMASHQLGIPPALLHNLKHNKVIHERVVLLTLVVEDIPYIKDSERVRVQALGQNFYRVVAQCGFKEIPNMQHILDLCQPYCLSFEELDTTFFLGRETLIPAQKTTNSSWIALTGWRQRLFIRMLRNSRSATDFFKIPSNRVIEIGTQIQL
ncbi:potassium transporter Kup [Beggiatoa leptomitoformis]|uniref:Probable potassium transport system protein Kup n=2 Tax=Beggiatoa leptomitoformis TaxID=288004 RepID=A0A2N9YJF4_9GAMM|nr:potassium transporter Kup [Beggiatoa leptomitoformis]AUI70640.1 potassium transporter Kup [Beggiatoa leptomitoformis]